MFALLNGWEITGIIALAFLFFGASKVPAVARSLGNGIREFRKSIKDS